jgi:hypothetical protein
MGARKTFTGFACWKKVDGFASGRLRRDLVIDILFKQRYVGVTTGVRPVL